MEGLDTLNAGTERKASLMSPPANVTLPTTVAYVEPLGGRRGPPRSLAVLAESSEHRAHYFAAQGIFLSSSRAHADDQALVVELPGHREHWYKLRSAVRCAVALRGEKDNLTWVANGLTGVWIAAPLATLRREPVILFFRDSAEPGRRARTAMQLWKRAGLKVVAVAPSQYGLEALLRSIDMTSLGVVPNAVTFVAEAPRQLPSRVKAGWIGNSRPIKGLDLTIRLAGRLADVKMDWLLFGSGLGEEAGAFPYVGECRELATDLGVDRYLSWRGYVDSRNIMDEIDLLVVTSERESCSRAILEALAHGVPILAPDVGGNSEILSGQLSACLFARSDISSAEAIARGLIQDRTRYQLMSQIGLQRAHAFEAQKVAKLFDQRLLAAGSSAKGDSAAVGDSLGQG